MWGKLGKLYLKLQDVTVPTEYYERVSWITVQIREYGDE